MKKREGTGSAAEELSGRALKMSSPLLKKDGDKYWLTYKYPDLFPALKYAVDPDVRKKAFHRQREQMQPERSSFQGDNHTSR